MALFCPATTVVHSPAWQLAAGIRHELPLRVFKPATLTIVAFPDLRNALSRLTSPPALIAWYCCHLNSVKSAVKMAGHLNQGLRILPRTQKDRLAFLSSPVEFSS
jgi:hypothetical protein